MYYLNISLFCILYFCKKIFLFIFIYLFLKLASWLRNLVSKQLVSQVIATFFLYDAYVRKKSVIFFWLSDILKNWSKIFSWPTGSRRSCTFWKPLSFIPTAGSTIVFKPKYLGIAANCGSGAISLDLIAIDKISVKWASSWKLLNKKSLVSFQWSSFLVVSFLVSMSVFLVLKALPKPVLSLLYVGWQFWEVACCDSETVSNSHFRDEKSIRSEKKSLGLFCDF